MELSLKKLLAKNIMLILWISLLLFILASCTQHRYVERITVDTIKVASPVIEDTLAAKVITDTVIIANEIVRTDTVIDVRYYPVGKKFYVKVKPDTVTIFKTDTVSQINIENKSNPIDTIFWIIMIVAGIVVIIKLIK